MAEQVILYSDLNCPFCYALGERLIRLGLDDKVEWRGVQHAPMLPIPREEDHAGRMAMIDWEVRGVQHLSPEVPIRTLTGKPNTGPAIRTIAAVSQVNPAHGRRLRTNLYRALWQCNEDISDSAVLASFVGALGLERVADESGVRKQTAEWQRAWEEIAVGSVPLLVRPDGELLSGLVSLEVLKAFVEGALAKPTCS